MVTVRLASQGVRTREIEVLDVSNDPHMNVSFFYRLIL